MYADPGISTLLLAANGQAEARGPGDPGRMARLANRYASEKLGLASGREPGAYLPVYETTERFVEEAVLETRDVVGVEDVYEERTVIETRDIVETRPVFEERAILETKVTGERRLTRYDSLSEAGIDRGADFAITVGDGATAIVKFASSSKISVTVDGATEEFTFNSWDGSFQDGLLAALNSVDGLSAGYSANGRLVLQAAGGQSLTIADVPNGWRDWSASPIGRLGLNEGVTAGEIVGYETIQTGTEEVVVGSEEVTVGTMLVKVGEQSVVTGTETVVTGTVSRFDGYDHKLVGLEEPEKYGAGVLGRLAEDGSGLPSNYVELLFGVVKLEEKTRPARVSEGDIRAAYDEAGGAFDLDENETGLRPTLHATGEDGGADAALI